ncbi:two-component sensor histidine kinase [Actinoplanes campanulatus]|nr:two-component sensor histidine kinase [Actinoplanes campanulatus]GID41832.1 two-component sensor histidine kinase [Actinoplanes campanulatus]
MMTSPATPREPDPFLRHPVARWMLGRRDRFRNLDQRHPWLANAVVAGLLLLFSLPEEFTEGREHEPAQPPALSLAAAALLLVPLWWRRRAPMAAFLAVAVILLAEWSLGVWISTGVVVLVMLYGVAARCSMRVVALAAGIVAAEFVFAVYVLQAVADHRPATVLLLLGTCSAGIAAGLAVRTFRAYQGAQSDRVTWLETQRDQQARLAVAAERARVAREMHDIVGHHVSIMIGLADGGAALATNRQEKAAEPLRLIGETGRQALGDLRRVLGVLRDDTHDPELTPQPGLADVDRLLTGVRAAGLAVTYRTTGDLHQLGQGLQLAVYRIVQEALTNTLKHAGQDASAQVTVTSEKNLVTVRVTDSGSPGQHPGPRSPDGHGIVGIRERASLYGGTVTAGPHRGGWAVDVTLTATGPHP